MNACDKHALEILHYLDNELRGQELKNFLTHLEDCAICIIQLDEEREFLNLLHRSRPLYTAPDQLRVRVMRLFQK